MYKLIFLQFLLGLMMTTLATKSMNTAVAIITASWFKASAKKPEKS